MRYRIVFEQINRGRQLPPLDIMKETDEPLGADVIAEVVYDHVKDHLRSREVEVVVDMSTSEGIIVVGGVRKVGSFTITQLEGVANA
jgi:hypothetical protein